MKPLWQSIGATMLSVAVATGAQAIPLSSLLAGGTLDAGGIAFTNFSASYGASDPLRVFDANHIDVTAIPGGPGIGASLRFDVGGGELTVRGNGTLSFVGLRMRFRAAPRDPAFAGHALTMESRPIDIRHGNRGVHVGDGMGSGPGTADPGDFPGMPWSANFADWNFPIAAVPAPDPAGLASQAGPWVHKNMLVWATDRANTVSLLVFSQRFDLELPEPGTLPLLAIAGLGAAAVLGKKRPAS